MNKLSTIKESTPSKPPKEFNKSRKKSSKPQLPPIWKKFKTSEKSIKGADSKLKSKEEKVKGSALREKRTKAIKNSVVNIIQNIENKGPFFILLTT